MCDNWRPHKSNLDVSADGLTHEDLKDASKCVYARRVQEFDHGEPVTQPLVASTGYRLKSLQHCIDICEQRGGIGGDGRLVSPTAEAVEAAVNQLEGGAGSLTFSSGTAAIATSFLTFLKAGDSILVCFPVQNCTLEIMEKVLKPLGVEIILIEGGSCDKYRAAVKHNTKVIFAETPGNPLISIIDLEGLGELATSLRDQGVITMVDGTFASPLLQKPLKYGIDLSIHSATKFLSGHGDLCGGVVTTRTLELWRKLELGRRTYGSTLSPYDASLLLRGIRSLHVRVPRQSSTAARLADYLSTHPAVERVYHAFHKSNPDREVAMRQMTLGGGMLCVLFKGTRDNVIKIFESLQLFNRGVSLGNCETLVDYPNVMSHGEHLRTEQQRTAWHIKDGHLRICCGLEDPEDLISDLKQALEKAYSDPKHSG